MGPLCSSHSKKRHKTSPGKMKFMAIVSVLLASVLVSVHSAPAPILDGGLISAVAAGTAASPASPFVVGGTAGAAFSLPVGLALGGGGVLTVPTWMLLTKAALLKKAAILGAGGLAVSANAGVNAGGRRPTRNYYNQYN